MEILNLTANTGNKETILKGINELTRENYINILNDYILRNETKKNMSDFEKGYTQMVDRNLFDLGRVLLRLEYENKTKEQMLDIILDWGLSGPYSFESHVDNWELSEFIKRTEVDPKTKFDACINFMKEQLDIYCLEIEKSEKEKERERKQKELETYKSSLKHYQDRVAKLEKELG